MAQYRTFYITATGKIVISRKMNDANVTERLAVHTDQSYINAYCVSPDTQRVNLTSKELEDIPVNVDYTDWMKQKRRLELIDCDWTQGVDSPLSDSKKAEWQTYRQQLRDLPSNYSSAITDRDSISWPTKPS
jgi:hypothetical protein